MIQSIDRTRRVPLSHKALADAEPKVPAALRIAYLAFAFTIPMDAITLSLTSNYVSLAKAAGYLMIVFAILHFSFSFHRIPKVVWWFGIYYAIFWFVALSGVEQDLPRVMVRGIQLLQLLLLFVISFNLFRSATFLLLTMKTVIYSVTLFSVLEMLGLGRTVLEGVPGRVSALNQNANTWGTIVAIALILEIGIALGSDGKGHRKWTVVLLGILMMELLRTASRSATAALLCSVVFFLLQGKGFGSKTRLLIVTLCIVAPVIGGAYELEGARWQAAGEGHFAARERIVPTAWQMFQEKPFFGWGPVTNLRELGRRTSGAEVLDTHNLPLWILTEVGLLGAIPFLVGWLSCLVLAWKARNGRCGLTPFAANFCFLLSNQAHTFHNLKFFWVILAIGAACGSYSIYRDERERASARLLPRRWHRFAWEARGRA